MLFMFFSTKGSKELLDCVSQDDAKSHCMQEKKILKKLLARSYKKRGGAIYIWTFQLQAELLALVLWDGLVGGLAGLY